MCRWTIRLTTILSISAFTVVCTRFLLIIHKDSEKIYLCIMTKKKPTYEELAEKVRLLEEEIKKSRKVQDALKESEDKFRTLTDSTPVAVFLYQNDRWIFVNRAAQEMTGYSEGELIAKQFWEVVHPDFVELVRDRGEKRQRGDTDIGRYEIKIIRKDGSEKWVNVTGASTTIGKKIAGVVSLIDIDYYKHAEAALKASEDKFRSLFDNAVEGVFQTTLKGRLLEANKAWARMFRYPSVEDALKEITDITHQLYVDPADRTKALYLLKKKGYINNYECRMYRKDKTIFWAIVNARMAALPDGAPCIQGFIANINKRKLAEEVLRESEERFRLLVENAPDGIFVQTNGQFAYVNNAAVRMFGTQTSAAMIGQPVLDRMHPDYLDIVRERIRCLNVDRKAVPVVEQKYLTLDGTPFDVEVSAVPILYDDEQGALVFFRDISDRKRAEEERERLLAELKEALAKVKVLSGFLPICAWCKKIRDDRGYWNQIETYIKEHSEAEFSHSICPECMEKLKKDRR